VVVGAAVAPPLLLHGLRIPEDMAIVGYDDVQFAEMSHVPLTSVRQPAYDLGYAGARLLLEEASHDEGHRHRRVRFEPTLVVRRSSAGAGAEALTAHALESGERALSGNGAAAASGTP
jgi:LacI family transcriptional regulator